MNEFVTVVNVVLVEATSRIHSSRSILTQKHTISCSFISWKPHASLMWRILVVFDTLFWKIQHVISQNPAKSICTLYPTKIYQTTRLLNLTKESKKWGCQRGLLSTQVWQYGIFFKGSIFIVHLPILQPSSIWVSYLASSWSLAIFKGWSASPPQFLFLLSCQGQPVYSRFFFILLLLMGTGSRDY